MSKTVAVIRGGPSSRFSESLKTGKSITNALLKKGFRVIDVVIDQMGQWLRDGKVVTPKQATLGADIAWNATHGEFGEDGKLQRTLRQINLPYTGPTPVGGALSLAKNHTREVLNRAGLKTPIGLCVGCEITESPESVASRVFRSVPMPAVVKPNSGGFSKNVRAVFSYPELVDALKNIFELNQKAIVEEMIIGKEATVGVIERFRGEPLYCAPATEICLDKGQKILDENCKREGIKMICPGRFNESEKNSLYDAARRAHEALGLRHLSRIDFIVHPKRGVFVLEVNSNPELGTGERLPKAIEAVGANLEQIAEHVVELTLSDF